jgi:dTDP-glucose pyrophosphorylase
MKSWKDVLIPKSTKILEAIKLIDTSTLQIALVVDKQGKLLGTVTDGDIRRGILKGLSLDLPVSEIMYSDPSIARISDSRETILAAMRARHLHQIPLINEHGCVVGLETWDELIQVKERSNPVVIMAGGLGSRLGHLTENCPKPMLKVGNKPLLETILEECLEYGFGKFYISINYKAEIIKEYFGDGSKWGVEIEYLHEHKRMGTAGSLSLLPEALNLPLIVINGDLLTKVNLKQLLDFHQEHNADATMCVREYDFQVPYGVVKLDKHNLVEIEEKPTHTFFVNAGIFVLDPKVLSYVPENRLFDMPELFDLLIKNKHEAAAFPIREYWIDIGQIDDFERASSDYSGFF